MKKLIILAAAVGLGFLAYQRLASLNDSRTQIKGSWHSIEMSFPSDKVWDFAEGIIRIDGLEHGTYTFRGHSKLEVVADGKKILYTIKFPDDSSMVWYRKVGKDTEKAAEFRRTENHDAGFD